MNLRQLDTWMLVPIWVAVNACVAASPEVSNKPFAVVVRATTDEGQPMPGARFTIGESTLGTTDPNGTFKATIRGADGQTVAVVANCPDGYIAPDKPTILRLTEVRKVNAVGPQSLGVEATCTRKMRDIVLVVRADNAPSLPVDVLGKTVGQTDANGFAHLDFQLDRDVRSLSVSLKTAGLPKLRPQNPSRVFELDGQDAVVLLDQAFAAERPVPVKRHKPVVKQEPVKLVPQRIE